MSPSAIVGWAAIVVAVTALAMAALRVVGVLQLIRRTSDRARSMGESVPFDPAQIPRLRERFERTRSDAESLAARARIAQSRLAAAPEPFGDVLEAETMLAAAVRDLAAVLR